MSVTINLLRRDLYAGAGFSGDVQAVRRGRVFRRIGRRRAGKPSGRLLGNLFR